MSKHTPGPWEPMKNSDGFIRGIRGMHGPVCANVVNWGGISRAQTSNGQANARLIAAAPDLLEALEAAVKVGIIPKSSAKDGGATRHSEQVRVADMCRDAIAKATGAAE